MVPIYGMQIIESSHMVDKKQNRKHGKKRINKKWIKRYGFTETPKTNVFKMGNTLVMHPTIAEKLRKTGAY